MGTISGHFVVNHRLCLDRSKEGLLGQNSNFIAPATDKGHTVFENRGSEVQFCFSFCNPIYDTFLESLRLWEYLKHALGILVTIMKIRKISNV